MKFMALLAGLNPRFDGNPQPDIQAHIQEFEQTFIGPLPRDYGDFLMENGKEILLADNRVKLPSGRKMDVRLASFYGLSGGRHTLLDWNRTYEGRIPPGLMVIGESGGGGDQVCLDVLGDKPGAVYHWDHEAEVNNKGDATPWYSNMVYLAESFTRLLELVQPVPEDKTLPKIVSIRLDF